MGLRKQTYTTEQLKNPAINFTLVPCFLHFHFCLVLIFYILFPSWDSFKTKHLLCRFYPASHFSHLQSPEKSPFHYCWKSQGLLAHSLIDRQRPHPPPPPPQLLQKVKFRAGSQEFTDFASCPCFIGSAPGYKIKQWQKFQDSGNTLSTGWHKTDVRGLPLYGVWCRS